MSQFIRLDDVKTMIGSGQIDGQIRQYIGVDAYGRDATFADSLAKEGA
jgi:methanogenic corrinoid protein MtbC1